MPFVLSETNSIANEFLRELRDTTIQKDRLRFRRNLERIAEILAYEVSKKLSYREESVVTPLGCSEMKILESQPVLLCILRAGLPFFQGFINFFDKADSGFIGAYRQESEKELTIRLNYIATMGLEGKVVILIDPMLATGRSVVDAVKAVSVYGKPAALHIVSLVSAPEGIDYLSRNLPVPHTLWTCAIDERLDPNLYIVPGLGDAGDLSFGAKL
jgi:uracil phosphoribosyltransferase